MDHGLKAIFSLVRQHAFALEIRMLALAALTGRPCGALSSSYIGKIKQFELKVAAGDRATENSEPDGSLNMHEIGTEVAATQG
jgi:hypothetical protein